jgi:uncharacterized membrane-anchored protein YhcB (DUF1043 family)
LGNLKRKLEEIDRERAAFNIEQSELEEAVNTIRCSLTKLMEDIISIQQDMTQMSTNLCVEIAKLKNLLLNMSANKQGRKQMKHKDTEATSIYSADQGWEQVMEGYAEIAHNMETSWDSMCESVRAKNKTSHA